MDRLQFFLKKTRGRFVFEQGRVMNIKIAEEKDFDDVKKITRETIMEIYPMYYPHGAVLFFAEHHSDENIMRDIRTGIVYLLISDEGIPVGTVTLLY